MTEENKTRTLPVLEWMERARAEWEAKLEKAAAEEDARDQASRESALQAALVLAERGTKHLNDLGLAVDRSETNMRGGKAVGASCVVGDYLFCIDERRDKTLWASVSKAEYPGISSQAFPLIPSRTMSIEDMREMIFRELVWIDTRCAERAAEQERSRVKAEEEAARLKARKEAESTPVEIPTFGGCVDADQIKNTAAAIARYAKACAALPVTYRGEMRKRLDSTLIDMVVDFGAWALCARTAQGTQDKEEGGNE